MIVACASRSPIPSSIPSGEHKTRALLLATRNPEADAAPFYRVGGVGYIMTEGGVRMPIGNPRHAEPSAGDFESLEHFEPTLFSEISPLLADSDGGLTMEYFVGDQELSPERHYYRTIRVEYATRFNGRMASLAEKSKRTRRPS